MGTASSVGNRAWLEMSDDESRTYLQGRLLLMARVLFWSCALLLVAVLVAFESVPIIKPTQHSVVVTLGAIGTLVAFALWRLLAGRALSGRSLHAIDAIFAIGFGVIFSGAAFFGWELEASMYINLIWHVMAVFLRAIMVPSTGRRTAVIGALSFVPWLLVSVLLVSFGRNHLPPSVQIGGVVFTGAAVTFLATLGSRTIYGLRRQVREAMQLGQYTLERKIGEGGMGVVYLAHHVLLRRPTAVKTLLPDRIDPESLSRFEREVQHMAQLTHANTVAVFDYGRSADGIFYYAMEYLGGGIDLQRLVANYGPLPPGRVVHILQQACRALQEAHDKGIIHRDVKPANMILCERGGEPDVIKVVDYGLAKHVHTDSGQTGKLVLGTPSYLAPEAVTNSMDVGPPADLYALGCVAYFLVSGKCVFDGKTPVDICIKHVTTAPRPLSERGITVSPQFEALIMRCLAKSAGDRPASASELIDELRKLPALEWSEGDARAWWGKHRAQIDLAPSNTATVTLAVDLNARA